MQEGPQACVWAPAPSPPACLHTFKGLMDTVPAGLVLSSGTSGEPFKPSQSQCPHQ